MRWIGIATLPNGPKKHAPLRTCVICGARVEKRGLVRIAARPDGRVVVDIKGKAPGRGAYVCGASQCAQRPVWKGRLDRALKTQIGADDWTEIQEYIESRQEAVPTSSKETGGL